MREFPFCPEGVPYFGVCLAIAVPLYLLSPLLLLLPGIALAFCLWFFRNPVRPFQTDPARLLSPCDARVMTITEEEDPDLGPCYRITMFLSVFNVHVNRVPLTARVLKQEYRPGKMLPAYKPHAAEENEKNRVVWETADGFRYAVHQITGILARRIISDVKPDQICNQGARFGMIKFGSCTELLVPRSCTLRVKPGDAVRGVRTVLAEREGL